jgi:hypothetical protein
MWPNIERESAMSSQTRYLNTDLDLISSDDLTPLAALFESHGLFVNHVAPGEEGRWLATLEMLDQATEPEADIATMVSVVESLPPPYYTVWLNCTLREFNIGYDCGAEPWAFNQGISSGLLARMASIGASLRFTLYPERSETSNGSQPAMVGTS